MKKYVNLSMILAFAMILSYVEALFPFTPGIPGIKLGLPNLAVVLVLFCRGPAEALLINCTRILLSGFLFGNLYSILYSLTGGIFSFVVMALLKKTGKFGFLGVSAAGGVSHNMGQLLAAAFVIRPAAVGWYAPLLIMAGCLTGFAIGLAAQAIQPRIVKFFRD